MQILAWYCSDNHNDAELCLRYGMNLSIKTVWFCVDIFWAFSRVQLRLMLFAPTGRFSIGDTGIICWERPELVLFHVWVFGGFYCVCKEREKEWNCPQVSERRNKVGFIFLFLLSYARPAFCFFVSPNLFFFLSSFLFSKSLLALRVCQINLCSDCTGINGYSLDACNESQTSNRQYDSYEHTEDYVEEISHKLFYYPELFISLSVTFTVYFFCVYFCCGLYLLAGREGTLDKQLLCIPGCSLIFLIGISYLFLSILGCI